MNETRWSKKRLGELCQVQTGGTPSRNKAEYFVGSIPWITTVALGNMYVSDSLASEFISEVAIAESSAKIIPANSILIGIRVGVGKSSITLCDIAINQDIAALTNIDECCDLKYLVRVLQTYQRYFDSVKRGATIQGITTGVLKQLEIPLPPLETQKKIAAVLDKAQELIDKRNEQLAKMDDFVQSVFLEMFGELTCNSKRLKKGKIRDLVSDVRYGCSKKADAVNGNYPILRMNNINYAGYWDFSDLKYVDLDNKELEKYLVYKGDLLFNRTNSKELVGKSAVYKREQPVAYAGYLIRVRVNERAVPEYIWGYLNSSHGKLTLQNMCKNIIGMANINAQELQDINILIPPLDLQNQFAAIVEKTEQQKSLMQQSLAEMENNFNSLMQRAFKGELF